MTGLTRRIISGAALGVGTIVFITLLWGLLDRARIQRLKGFPSDADGLTGIVVVEVVGMALIAAIIVWKRKTTIGGMVMLAVVVWIASAFNAAFLALGGAVPD